MDAVLVAEEMYAIESSASLTILGTGLGLTPVSLTGNQKYLQQFLSGEGSPLASFVFSEPAGSANYADSSGTGLATVAVEDGDDYVISGEKASSPFVNGVAEF